VTARVLLDNSAWARFGVATLPQERAEEIADALAAGKIATSVPFLLEAGYSARDVRERTELIAELRALPHYALDEAVEDRALDAQAQLARVGHHRLPPVYLLIAALAGRHRLGILHYDRDYHIIAQKTDLDFESVWLASRGTL
jgi:predicted nucleic acid-binding protein